MPGGADSQGSYRILLNINFVDPGDQHEKDFASKVFGFDLPPKTHAALTAMAARVDYEQQTFARGRGSQEPTTLLNAAIR